KFSDYTTYQLMGQANLMPAGTNAHTLMLSLRGNEILAYYDGAQRIVVNDAGVSPLASGGICIEMYTESVPYTFFVDNVQVSSKVAAVTLGNLSQVYDGTPKVPSVSTLPNGLTVNLTYDGSSTAPVSAGSYQVVATVLDSYYSGQATGTLTVAPR